MTPIGTISVENYQRPAWTFNKILYIEKEGFFRSLKDAKFPERHDIALLTSKGYASRAVRDLLDMLGDTEEEILFFCVHDADAAGTKIYESLQEETKARPGRKVKIINLGLEPEEALQMGLEPESIENKDRNKAVADYVPSAWKTWLQTNRVELNAMTTPQFLGWLEGKILQYDNGKIIPPNEVIKENLLKNVDSVQRRRLQDEILREANFEERAADALKKRMESINNKMGNIRQEIEQCLCADGVKLWKNAVWDISLEITGQEILKLDF
ncbi:hypothetical protein [Desulfoscipio sp. XC116]|uniref:hypothetical protein n=1 Tax=Desulfoscipio sp. XC116 TaxID=3144975 RepID=UPI00325C3431